MPLHDWAALAGWEGVHQVWIVELLYWIKPRLPVPRTIMPNKLQAQTGHTIEGFSRFSAVPA